MAFGKSSLIISIVVFTILGVAAVIVSTLISHHLSDEDQPLSAYEKCLLVASKFSTTISNGPVSEITATTGVNVTCPQLSDISCPGTMINGICTWQRKLAVTCISNSTVRIRIQSNGLPGRCMLVSSNNRIIEQNIDFEVDFNPRVNVKSPIHSPTNQNELTALLCNNSNGESVPASSNLIIYSQQTHLTSLVGISIDNLAILNINNEDNVDSFYPPIGDTLEIVDTCLSQSHINGIYHYRIASGCIVSSHEGNISKCEAFNGCSTNIAAYSLASFPLSTRKLTIIGIAKDGHVIYGPYLSSEKYITSGVDICNGMFYNHMGDYAYFATSKYPYLIGCFGPGNYPSFGPKCTDNGQLSYSMSAYAAAHL